MKEEGGLLPSLDIRHFTLTASGMEFQLSGRPVSNQQNVLAESGDHESAEVLFTLSLENIRCSGQHTHARSDTVCTVSRLFLVDNTLPSDSPAPNQIFTIDDIVSPVGSLSHSEPGIPEKSCLHVSLHQGSLADVPTVDICVGKVILFWTNRFSKTVEGVVAARESAGAEAVPATLAPCRPVSISRSRPPSLSRSNSTVSQSWTRTPSIFMSSSDFLGDMFSPTSPSVINARWHTDLTDASIPAEFLSQTPPVLRVEMKIGAVVSGVSCNLAVEDSIYGVKPLTHVKLGRLEVSGEMHVGGASELRLMVAEVEITDLTEAGKVHPVVVSACGDGNPNFQAVRATISQHIVGSHPPPPAKMSVSCVVSDGLQLTFLNRYFREFSVLLWPELTEAAAEWAHREPMPLQPGKTSERESPMAGNDNHKSAEEQSERRQTPGEVSNGVQGARRTEIPAVDLHLQASRVIVSVPRNSFSLDCLRVLVEHATVSNGDSKLTSTALKKNPLSTSSISEESDSPDANDRNDSESVPPERPNLQPPLSISFKSFRLETRTGSGPWTRIAKHDSGSIDVLLLSGDLRPIDGLGERYEHRHTLFLPTQQFFFRN